MLETNPEPQGGEQPDSGQPPKEEPAPANLDIAREKVSREIKESRKSDDLGEGRSSPGKTFSILILIIVILATAGVYALIMFRNSQIGALNSAITKDKQKLASSDLKQTEEILLNLKKQIETLKSFKQSQALFSKLLTTIQSATHQKIKFSSVAVSPEGQIDFSGESENYQTLAKFIVSLRKNQLFGEVKLNSSSLVQSTDKTRVSFAITAKIKNSLLIKTNSEKSQGTGTSNSLSTPASGQATPSGGQGGQSAQ